jgi:putative sugar O-methyltransferase
MAKRICIWGRAFGIDRIVDTCLEAGVEVLAVLDNDPAKHGSWEFGLETVHPDRLPDYAPDYVLVVSHSFEAISDQAAKLGYPTDRLLSYHRRTHESMERIGAQYCVYHDTYSMDASGELEVHRHKHAVTGKVGGEVPSPVPFDRQRELAARLLEAFARARRDARDVPPAFQVGANWEGVLRQSRCSLYDAVEVGDVEQLAGLLGNYFRNCLSDSILGGEKAYRSFLSSRHDTWLQHNLEVWMALVDGQASIRDAGLPPIGNPYGYLVDGAVINWNSFVNHGRAHRCLKLLADSPAPVVAEIGGGFGGFAYNLLKQAPGVTYLDFDLPENLIIASYTLGMAFPDRRILLYDSQEQDLSPETLKNFDVILMPNFMLPKLRDESVDLLVNTISFSEMEYATIQEYFLQAGRVSSQYVYHENLSCHPPYKGYPTAVFPRMPGFRELICGFSAWQGFDAYTKGHSYLERLLVRRDESRVTDPVRASA